MTLIMVSGLLRLKIINFFKYKFSLFKVDKRIKSIYKFYVCECVLLKKANRHIFYNMFSNI